MSASVVSWPLLLDVFRNMRGRVGYGLGAKAPSLGCDSSNVRKIDCSGFVRYAIAKASGCRLVIPDGSVLQHDWCDQKKLRRLAHYSDVQYAIADPSRWFLCFLEPHPIGHVWLVNAGRTYESHGGLLRRGVDSRAWDTKALLKCQAAYEVTDL